MAKALISRHKASIAVLLCGMAFGITGAMTINVRAASVVLPQIAPEGVVQGEFEVTTSAKGDETLIVPLHVSAETPRLAFRAQHVSGAVRPIGYSGYAEVRYDHYTTQLTLSDGSTWQFSTPGATWSSSDNAQKIAATGLARFWWPADQPVAYGVTMDESPCTCPTNFPDDCDAGGISSTHCGYSCNGTSCDTTCPSGACCWCGGRACCKCCGTPPPVPVQ